MNPGLLGATAALSWGTMDFISRYPSRAVGHLNTVFATTITGFAILSAIMWFGDFAFVMSWRHAWLLALSGAAIALATMWLFAALVIGPVSVVSPIVASYPVLSVAYAVIMGSRPNALEWAAMAAVVTGVVVVSAVKPPEALEEAVSRGVSAAALKYAFLSNIAFAVALTSGQVAVPVFGELQTLWAARPFGAAILICLFFLPGQSLDLPIRLWPLFVLMGALDAMSIGLVLAAGDLPKAEIAQVTASCFGVVTVVLAWIILRERIPLMRWAGMVLIFAGVAVLSS